MKKRIKKVFKALLFITIFVVGLIIGSKVSSFKNETPVPVEPAPNPIVIVEKIKEIGRLESISQFFQQTIVKKRNPKVLWGAVSQTLIFNAYGQVIAGIDLTNFNQENIRQVDNSRTYEILNFNSEIFIVSLDNEKSYIVPCPGAWLSFTTGTDKFMETQVRQEAEQKIRESALQNGILDLAKENAKIVVTDFLKLFFDDINIIFIDNVPSTTSN